MRTLEVHSEMDQDVRKSGTKVLAPGPIYSFVPAHGEAKADLVAAQFSRTLSEGFGCSVLLADFETHPYSVAPASTLGAESPLGGMAWHTSISRRNGHDVLHARCVDGEQIRPVFEQARKHYSLVCADLSGASEHAAADVLRASDAIFLIASSAWQSLDAVRLKAEWLRSVAVDRRCGLILWRAPRGAAPLHVEEFAGVPVCSVVQSDEQIGILADWLATRHDKAARKAQSAA